VPKRSVVYHLLSDCVPHTTRRARVESITLRSRLKADTSSFEIF
jgi:hypothetical protein